MLDFFEWHGSSSYCATLFNIQQNLDFVNEILRKIKSRDASWLRIKLPV